MSTTKEWKKIPLDLYKSKILIFKGSPADFMDLARRDKYNILPPEEDSVASTWDLGGIQIIYLAKDAVQSELIHECLHVVFNLCRYVGIKVTDEEALCYMLEYIVERI